MTRNVACRMVVFASAVLMIFAGCSQRRTGPWDMQTLKSPPAFQWADKAGMIKSLYYTGEPFNGQPTRVFAYYAAPEGVKGKVPGMVLVHGGGGKAFPEWVELWNKRGYAAIAMDLAGHGPGWRTVTGWWARSGTYRKIPGHQQGNQKHLVLPCRGCGHSGSLAAAFLPRSRCQTYRSHRHFLGWLSDLHRGRCR